MNIYGLIGYPLGHSFSAGFFSKKFQEENIEAIYKNFEIQSIEQLPEIITSHPELKGLNVTIPYKQQIINYLDELSEEARNIGAVNVVKIIRKGNKMLLKGYNADVIGFTNSIEPLIRKDYHQKALVLGTGGASKAVMYGLNQLGLKTRYVSRRKQDTNMLVYEELTAEIVGEYPVIINCTPCGMFPHVNECPELPYEAITTKNLLYDLIYNPDETLFMAKGKERGAIVKNGLEMLHLQALASWDFWQKEE